jgi:N-acetylglucosamine-6-phosphate deacetylase
MNDGTLSARHFGGGHSVRVSWRTGVITSVEAAEATSDQDLWIAPALVDLQVNGFAGIDFQQDDLTPGALAIAAHALRAAGCTRFFLTLITDDWTKLMRRLQHLHGLRAASAELRQAIAGWHLEGPFLSAEPGYCGAHNPELMLDPTLDHIRELRAATGTDPLLLTLAPERAGAISAIRLAVSLGMKVSLGHTNAAGAALRGAVDAGATGFTHLANACPQLLDRHDNILWRVLDTPGLTVSLIPDGRHVSPELFRIIHSGPAGASLYYVTDAMSAAGARPGRYPLGPLEFEVGADGTVRRPGQDHFAGSALRPVEGVRRAARMLHTTWRAVWEGFSTRPAQFMGLKSGLIPGAPADFCLLRSSGGDELAEPRMIVAGKAL